MRSGSDSRVGWLFVATMHLLIGFCYGQSAPAPPPETLPAGGEITVRAQPQKATVGDPIQIDLDITLPRGYTAVLPKLGNQLADFAVLEYYPGPSLPPDGTASAPQGALPRNAPSRHQARLIVALYKTGEFEFPPLPISLRSPDGKEIKLASRPVKIDIQSVLVNKDPQLKGLKKQAEIQEPVRWLLWLASAFLLVILALLAWWLHRRRRPPVHLPDQPEVDPLVLAEADLRDLIRRDLLEKGFVKQFYVILSDIVKRILEAGYAIHTIEKTTSEIMDELQHGQAASPAAEDFQRVASLLSECDLVKFAKYVPSRAEIDSTVKSSYQILESARKLRPATAPVEGEATIAGVS